MSKEQSIEVAMTDRIGDLAPAQIRHLSVGLEHAHEMTLEDAGGSHYWLQSLDGGALLIRAFRTVEHVWNCATAISAQREVGDRTPLV